MPPFRTPSPAAAATVAVVHVLLISFIHTNSILPISTYPKDEHSVLRSLQQDMYTSPTSSSKSSSLRIFGKTNGPVPYIKGAYREHVPREYAILLWMAGGEEVVGGRTIGAHFYVALVYFIIFLLTPQRMVPELNVRRTMTIEND